MRTSMPYKPSSMKSFKNWSFLAMLLSLGIIFNSCQDENFDAPPHERPIYLGESSITISDFKTKYNTNFAEVTTSDTITGIITANDISGNLYKQIFIEDETGGLLVAIDRNSLHNDLRIGQRIYIETKGLYMGKYGGLPQLGYRYSRNNDGVYTIGQMPWELTKKHLFRDDYPDPEAVVPTVIDYNQFNADNYSRLVKLEGVFFDNAGDIFSYPTADGGVQTIDRTIRFAADNSKTIIGRMSSAANFAAQTIPSGVGSVTGILTVFNTTVQFLIRDITDLDFEENPDGWGLENSPWSVSYALQNQDTQKNGWVYGFIVGSIQPGVNESNPITSNEQLAFEAPFIMDNYLVIAQSADETNWENCLVVNLPSGSVMRTVLNLRDNEANLGKEVSLRGSLETILGAAGVRVANGSAADFKFGGTGEIILEAPFKTTLAPFTAVSVTGSQGWVLDPYEYAKMTGYVNPNNFENEDWLISPAINLTDFDAAHVTFEHVSRYGNNSLHFTLWVSSDYTGGSPTTATWTQIPIANYSSGSSWTDWTNSGNLNIPSDFTAKNNVYVALKYISTSSQAGTWEVRNLKVISGIGHDGGGVDPGDDNFDNPLTVDQAMTSQNMSLTTWVEGYIVGVVKTGTSTVSSANDVSFNAPFDSQTNVMLADNASETDYTKCIIVNLPAGKPLRSQVNLVENPGNKGKVLKVKGNLRTYFGVPGIRDMEGETTDFVLTGGGITDPSGTIFLETFGGDNHLTNETRPKIGDFTGYDNANVTFSDPSDRCTIRSTSTLDAHVWMPTGNDTYLTIDGINTSGYTDINLQFDFTGNGSANANKLIVKVNGIELTIPSVNVASNTFSTIIISEPISLSETVKIEFIATAANNTVGFRLDNIKLTGTPE
jgi:hypothetical protein